MALGKETEDGHKSPQEMANKKQHFCILNTLGQNSKTSQHVYVQHVVWVFICLSSSCVDIRE
jgi:hypothetical protein